MKRSISRVLALFVLGLTISLSVAHAENGASSPATDKLSQKKEANALKWKRRFLRRNDQLFIGIVALTNRRQKTQSGRKTSFRSRCLAACPDRQAPSQICRQLSRNLLIAMKR